MIKPIGVIFREHYPEIAGPTDEDWQPFGVNSTVALPAVFNALDIWSKQFGDDK